MKQLRSIEAALRNWEDRSLIYCANALVQGKQLPLLDAVRAWPGLRQDLHEHMLAMQEVDGESEEEVQRAFAKATAFNDRIIGTYMGGDIGRYQHALGAFPSSGLSDVIMWLTSGALVYNVSAETHAMLNMCDLGELRWKDVPWPTVSFIVAFEAPLVGRRMQNNGGDIVDAPYKYDGIMVWRADTVHPTTGARVNAMIMRLFATRSRDAFLSLEKRTELADAVAKRDVAAATRLLAVAKQHASKMIDTRMVMPADTLNDQLISESIHEFMTKTHLQICKCGGTHPEWDQAAQLVVKLCKYLSIAPESAPFQSEWDLAKVPTGLHPLNVVQHAAISHVHCQLQLTPRQRASMLERGEIENPELIKGHTRGMHFRRPAGKGNDPEWPRTEFVFPCCPNIEKTSGEQRAALEAWLAAALPQARHIKEQLAALRAAEKSVEKAPLSPEESVADAAAP